MKTFDLGAVTAYALAVEHGFEGTEEEWLASLKGDRGDQGVPGKFEDLTEEEKETLRGYPGYTPQKGVDYVDGETPHIGDNGNWFVGEEDTGKPSRGEDGQDGYTPQKGVDYFDGNDGYTPVKGVDYWTPTEQKEVTDAVNAANNAADEIRQARENGEFDGEDGRDGYTPQKGVDYSDGKDGTSVTHEWNGTRLRVTSASGTTEADLKGDPGTGITILGSYDTEDALRAAHATGKPGDGYMVSGDLYVWSEEKNDWDNVGRIKGEPGQDGYTPVKGVDYFDGKDGQDGHTPVKGVDYWTEAEQKAVSDAVSAANTAAGAANTAAGNANNAADAANTAAGAAETAVGNANEAAGNANAAAEEIRQAKANGEFDGEDGKDGYTPVKDKDYFDGKDGVSVTHSWNGTTLTVTSASGTTSADLKGEKGDSIKGDPGYTPQKNVDYFDGQNGKDGTSVTVSSVTESTEDGGTNVVNFSDGKKVNIKNGSKGSKGDKGDPYTLTDTDKNTIAAAVKASLTKENWTFTLEDGSPVTKAVYVG